MNGSVRFVVLAAFGALTAAGCNDTYGACVAACEHGAACATADGGGSVPRDLFPPASQCKSVCAEVDDAGYRGCKNPRAEFDCISALSCEDIACSSESDACPQGPLFQNCILKAECPSF